MLAPEEVTSTQSRGSRGEGLECEREIPYAEPAPPPPVNCQHAGQISRRLYVTCGRGLYGGTPHAAICRSCPQRVPLAENAPSETYLKAPPRVTLHKREIGAALLRAEPTARADSHRPGVRTQRRLLLRSYLSPGDILMLTAAVRDLHRAYPNQFQTAVETSASDLWMHNPYVVPRGDKSSAWEHIDMHYPLIHWSNTRPVHFIEGYASFLAGKLGLNIPVTEFRADIHLTEQEKEAANQLQQMYGYAGRFWIVIAGGKYDFTTKWWPPDYYQKVIDHFEGRIQFVQCGQLGHWHPPLRGVINFVGKTSTRQFIRLMYHAEGVLCPITFAMHLAAAVPTKTRRLRPCVVVAGGREPPQWEAYPGHQFLHTIGNLSCCASGGCWKSRCQLIDDKNPHNIQNRCERPVKVAAELSIAKCMTMIRPADVIRAIERALIYSE
jgi:ADP-heptose:LPS heptosyltransferase